MDDLERLKRALEAGCDFKVPPDDAKAAGLCCACGLPALERCQTDAGRREYRISGMCEVCFDACTQEHDDECDCSEAGWTRQQEAALSEPPDRTPIDKREMRRRE